MSLITKTTINTTEKLNELIEAHNELCKEHDLLVKSVNDLCEAFEAMQGMLAYTPTASLDS